jgi:hypothetical protein
LFPCHVYVQGVSSDGDLLDLGIGEESGCDGSVKERDKEALTVFRDFDLFQWAKVDQAEYLVDVGSCSISIIDSSRTVIMSVLDIPSGKPPM